MSALGAILVNKIEAHRKVVELVLRRGKAVA
jgi:hypothetical protein